MIEFPDLGITYQEFTITLPFNGHKRRHKVEIAKRLAEYTILLAEEDPDTFCSFFYDLVFRARLTHVEFRVLWIDRKKWTGRHLHGRNI